MNRKVKIKKANIVHSLFGTIGQNKTASLLIFTGFILQMLIILPSGSHYCYQGKCGLYFWGVHGRDAIWHLAVASVSFSQFPIIHPIFAGSLLSGYNVLLDFILFLLSKIGIPPIVSFFKLLPIIWFVIFTYISVRLSKKINNSPIFLISLLFLFYFAGSFSYLFTLRNSHSIWGSGGLLSMQSMLTLTNLQLAFSFIVLMGILLILHDDMRSFRSAFILSVLLILQLGLKFYGGVISCFIVGLYLLEMSVQGKWKMVILYSLLIGASSVLAVIVFYNPMSSLKTGSSLIFAPFAHAHAMIEEPTLFYLKDLTNARYYLYAQKVFSLRLICIELFSFFLFLFFNLGTRFFGILYFLLQLIRKKIDRIELYAFGGVVFGTVLTILFIQKGDWWNTIQFFYYVIFLSNIFLANYIYKLIKEKKLLGISLAVIILVLSCISSIDVIKDFTLLKQAIYIPDSEMQVLAQLNKEKKGIVYIPYFYSNNDGLTNPYSISAAVDTAYVSAMSGKQSYFADEKQLLVTGIDSAQRKGSINSAACSILNGIDYVYVPQGKSDRVIDMCVNTKQTIFHIVAKTTGATLYKKY